MLRNGIAQLRKCSLESAGHHASQLPMFEVVVERSSKDMGSVSIEDVARLAGLLLGGDGLLILMSDDGSHERWLQCEACQPVRVIEHNRYFICALLSTATSGNSAAPVASFHASCSGSE
jgi:hypothetical protein